MALKWLNRLSSLLQHLFDLRAIKTEMIMMMMLKVLMQCSSFYNMINQNLHMYNNFIFAGWTVFNRKINKFEKLVYNWLISRKVFINLQFLRHVT